jgi:hypothetical protein
MDFDQIFTNHPPLLGAGAVWCEGVDSQLALDRFGVGGEAVVVPLGTLQGIHSGSVKTVDTVID